MSFQNPVFIPGPTNIPESLRKACDMPTIDHRSPLFGQILHPARKAVQQILKSTSAEVFIFPASGTGGWETALTNTLSAGDSVLVARNGMFSHRWIDMCQRFGLDVQIVDVPWGQGVPADRFEEILAADKDHKIKAVLATHNETATGVKSDIAAVRRAMNAAGHPALYFVDCVSSLGSMDFRMDEWGVDIAIAGSQKGFMLNMVLAVLAVSPKALAAMEGARLPRTFFDFRDMLGAYDKGSFPYTPPIQLIAGLRESLDMLFEEGLPQVYARHHRLAEGVRRAVAAWPLKLVAETPDLYSDSVSAIHLPEGIDGHALIRHAYTAYGMSFGAGLGKLDGRAFRIGHLGAMTEAMALSGIATVEMALADMDVPITLGAGVAAAQEHYRNTRGAALRKVA